MGETATNIATLNMNDALKVRVKDGCEVEDPCSSSPCPPHSRCRNTWDGYACVCDRGGRPQALPAPARPWGRRLRCFNPPRHAEQGAGSPAPPCGRVVPELCFVTEEGLLRCLFAWGQGHSR